MKRVVVTGGGAFALDPRIEVGWEDVWLRLHSRRRPLRLAPCLIGRENLRGDIAIQRQIVADPKYAHIADDSQVELARLERTLAQVDAFGIVIDAEARSLIPGEDPGRAFVFADIYTARPWINRAEAASMLDVYLAIIGVNNAVYKWKRPEFFVWPTTITAEVVERTAA